jgi:hypothetical protein
MERQRRSDDELAPSRQPAAISAYERGRYRHDPAYRLKRINHTRSLRGMPLVASLDEIKRRREA